jgi:molybdate transport system substrate-binding protein
MKKRKVICSLFTICLGVFIFTACSSNTTTSKPVDEKTTLKGRTLFVYCGAGMTKPFTEIVEAFQNKTGATVDVTYANAAQIISQITASNEGDLFIPGDQGELSTIQEEYVADTKSLVKHIPVIAVQTKNPKSICAIKDLSNEDIKVVLGDSEATPIGKLSDKALTDAGILDSVNVIARTTTAPEIATALSLGQCDAAIIWKENVNVEGVEIVETTDMEKYIKTVPAASLKCSTNTETLEAFLLYLETDTAKDIWENYGYELLN